MISFNYHTHTHYCDGTSAPEEYVISAMQRKMKALGFSSHAPVPFENNYAIQNIDRLKEYCNEVTRLKGKYRENIDIFLGLEADYIPEVTLGFNHFLHDFKLDYIIGSVHLVKGPGGGLWFIDGPDRNTWIGGLENFFDGNIKKAVTTYYSQLNEMICTQRPDIVGHLDKVKMHNGGQYFSEDEAWYRELVTTTLELTRQHNVIIEVNTRGIYKKRADALFPGIPVLKQMLQLDIPVTISSDAHQPAEVDLLFGETVEILKSIGYGEVYRYAPGWKAVPLD